MNRRILPICGVLCLSLSVAASEPPPTYVLPEYSTLAVSADFNGDGVPDVAVAGSTTVSVLLGIGDGTFQGAVTSPGSWYTDSLAVGDFDQDGRRDLATSDAILLGRGDGTFAYEASGYGLRWSGLAVGDLDGDGHEDLVGTTGVGCDEYWCYGAITVQLGNGDGTFATPWYSWDWYSDGGPTVLADFDGDGALDVAGGAGLLLGNGDGTLRSTGLYVPTGGVADFNGDGIPDAASAWSVQLGNGDGTFGSIIYPPADGAGPIALADLNGDARPDMAIATSYGVGVLLGGGDGTLRPPVRFDVAGSWGAWEVVAADFDGDGLPDLAATGYDGANYVVSILVNDGVWPALDAPSITISDPTVSEGNSGTIALDFIVSLSAAYSAAVTVDYSTADSGAVGSGDYEVTSGTLTIAAGQTQGTIRVPVIGDRLFEPDEALVVDLDGPTNAFLVDRQGVGTILDDEPRIRVTYAVAKAEGRQRQTTPFPFAVTLSRPYDEAVRVSFRTLSGSANKSDYVGQTGSLTINPGETTGTITISVKGDNKREPNEAFYVELYGPSSNALLESPYGTGTILNDD